MERKGILITVILGDYMKSDGSNIIQSLFADTVPQIGAEFMSSKIGRCKVKNVIYDYTQVDKYDYESPERGGERVWLFV
jgi:hypothetical protein